MTPTGEPPRPVAPQATGQPASRIVEPFSSSGFQNPTNTTTRRPRATETHNDLSPTGRIQRSASPPPDPRAIGRPGLVDVRPRAKRTHRRASRRTARHRQHENDRRTPGSRACHCTGPDTGRHGRTRLSTARIGSIRQRGRLGRISLGPAHWPGISRRRFPHHRRPTTTWTHSRAQVGTEIDFPVPIRQRQLLDGGAPGQSRTDTGRVLHPLCARKRTCAVTCALPAGTRSDRLPTHTVIMRSCGRKRGVSVGGRGPHTLARHCLPPQRPRPPDVTGKHLPIRSRRTHPREHSPVRPPRTE
jgi:hypothetical protein